MNYLLISTTQVLNSHNYKARESMSSETLDLPILVLQIGVTYFLMSGQGIMRIQSGMVIFAYLLTFCVVVQLVIELQLVAVLPVLQLGDSLIRYM